MNLLCNAFNDPSSPWYYVVGVVFLVLIFGALAAYVILSKKLEQKKNGGAEPGEAPVNAEQSAVDQAESAPVADEQAVDAAEQPDSDGSAK